MHATLIHGASKQDRLTYISQYKLDHGISIYQTSTLELSEEKESIGIKDVKDWSNQLVGPKDPTIPYLAVITDAHLLTTEAQNALLKLLEEPPRTMSFIIETASPSHLLPTICSRCIEQPIIPNEIVAYNPEFMPLLTTLYNPATTIGTWMQTVDTILSTKELAKQWVIDTIYYVSHTLTTNPHHPLILSPLASTLSYIQSNSKYQCALDMFFLEFTKARNNRDLAKA